MWFEFSADLTEQIEQAEQDDIPLRFYNLRAQCYQGLYTCEGDLVVICNTLADYADIIEEFIRQSDYDGYQRVIYELHAKRCRKISLKIQEQIGYDRLAAIERCKAKRKYYGDDDEEPNDDIGEDALVMMVKRNRENAKKEEQEHERSNDHAAKSTGEPK